MSDRQEDINKLLLDPTFRNWALKANALDHQYWTRILARDKDLCSIADQAKNIVLNLELQEYSTQSSHSARALEHIQRRLLELERSEHASLPSIPDHGIGKAKQFIGMVFRIAAIVVFFVSAGWMVYRTVTDGGTRAESEVNYVEKRTTSGQQLSVKLPDGTTIKLNNNSLLKVPENYLTDRRVILEGEAFFDVTRNEYLPFRIHTGKLMVEVLGTSFNVQATEEEYFVSVVSGKVRVKDTVQHAASAEAILHERQALMYSSRTSTLEPVQYNPDDLLWKDGILVFKNQSIRDIAAKLEQWFNVDITLESEQYIGSHYTAKYPRESLEEILIGMGTVLNFDFEIDNNHVLIKGKPQEL
jgi:ferric-dicitrate binding protein FerR (iron transport regulator)